MSSFQLASTFAPAGSQPEAIKKLIKGLEENDQYQTLLGVTGSGKTFTMANVIAPNDSSLENGNECLLKRWKELSMVGAICNLIVDTIHTFTPRSA
jgi:hypothetical protein